ncbi:TPA: DUF916 and DUF3324 domain-containing protein [Enterococcus faecalis]|uniref:DUF916 and DUF3324 domain-containing protein n=1 Tax=Enterococcus faecalis TaxID=1351 RepID=UPI00115ECF20|nr:DUF916 and DUF3324 domain-containing protein [Enterococcus faecalis]HAP4788028.1 DUF916 and DUF3324 domain-containing protein [Enterococcus faecalis]HAP5685650.1 DUF916 and DUF3324 domain-containing protein [Enterococcus faecalis]
MKKWALYSMCILSLFAGGYHAQAEESDSSQLAGGYTIEGIPSDHQLDKTVSYFYLKENPGEKDQVKVKLTNDSDKEKTLEVKLTNANTNSNGAVDYTGKIKDHASLKDPLTSMAKVSQKEVQVPAKSSVETAIDIQMPEKTMSGVVVGGIVVSEKQTVEKEKQALSLGNIYTYTIGLVLTNEDTVEPKKNNSVELDTVGAKLSDGKKIVQADILNPNPYIFPNATVKGEIKPKASGEVIKKEEKKNVNIAPYSVYPFQFDWKKEELKPGKYVFVGSVDAGGKTWKFEREFEITDEKAKEINTKSVFKVYIPKWVTYGVYALVIISVGGTIYIVVRRKRREAE